MGCCAGIGRCVLIILNVIFVIISLALIAVGVIFKFFPGTLMQFLFSGIQGLTQFKIPAAAGNVTTVPILDELGVILIAFGCILFFISFFACCGACCKWRVLLILYCICVILLIIIIATVGGLFLAKDSVLHNTVKTTLKEKVKNDYKGPQDSSGDVYTLIINILSYSLDCCAITGPDDFDANAAWKTYSHGTYSGTIDTSPACCNKTVLPTDEDFSCAKKTGSGVYNPLETNTKGCYDAITGLVQQYQLYAILVLCGLLLLMVLEVVFAVVLIMEIGEQQKTHPM